MQNTYILSFDQGTTSTRAILYDNRAKPITVASAVHEQIYPSPGWVSHNADEIFRNIVKTGREAIKKAGVDPRRIAAIGITNQRETTVLWDAKTGLPVCDAVVWQCGRSAGICQKTLEDGLGDAVRSKTGLMVNPYFSATKIKWLFDNVPEVKKLHAEGRLRAGTVDSYLIWRLSGGLHVTDYTNASRTMLFNINSLQWDDGILDYFQIPKAILPEVVSSSGAVGQTLDEFFGTAIPIAGIAGDQHAALFGQTCFAQGDTKNTYGTGCFILQNIGREPVLSERGLLTTIAWHIEGKPTYAIEGSIYCAGATVEWLIGEMGIVADTDELNHLCESVEDTAGVYFVPAFTGLGAPYWDFNARGLICGLTLAAGRAHVARAAMEAIACQTRDVLECIHNETGIGMKRLSVDGGVSKSDFLMQYQADILNILVERPADTETTALGAAYLAGLGVGAFDSLNGLKSLRSSCRVFTPSCSYEESASKYSGWLEAVNRARMPADAR